MTKKDRKLLRLAEKLEKGFIREWKKVRGTAIIQDIKTRKYLGKAEVHWYEAPGTGRVEWKIKGRVKR